MNNSVRRSHEFAASLPLLPLHLTRVPGLVGWIIDWIEQSATQPSRDLALGAALSVVGTAMGRCWCGPTSATTGLYVAAMDPTGCGKAHALESAKLILRSAGMQSRIGVPVVKSDTAIEMHVREPPCSLCCSDRYDMKPPAIMIPWHDQAAEPAYTELRRKVFLCGEKNPKLVPVLARVAETAIRLATIHAGRQSNLKPSVTLTDIEWGRRVALWSIEYMLAAIEDCDRRSAR